ncbi:Fc.00g028920.m01.CDS01 [Cosmosporella sp. VM-42]
MPRPKKRLGRRPGLRGFSHGTCSVITFSSEAEITSSEDPKSLSTELPEYLNQPLEYSSGPGQVKYHRDQKPRRDALSSLPLYPQAPSFLGQSQLESTLRTREGFFELHRHFMIGKTFAEEYRSSVWTLFTHAPAIVGLGYTAVLELLSYRNVRAGGLDGFDLTLGSRCLQHLQRGASSIVGLKDAAVTLILGQVLLVYNTLASCSSSRTITRSALLCVRSWYPTLLQHPALDSIALAPVLADTVECLIRRELPVLRLPDTERVVVDRLLGVCLPLLQLIYDLCEQSYQAKIGAPKLDGRDPYFEVEQKLNTWIPTLPPDFFTKYQASEGAAILAQARLYRTAALLVIHRLRFPLGLENRLASSYAASILQDLSIFMKWPTDGVTGLGLDFPLLVAVLELPSPGESIFKAFELLRFRREHSDQILSFMKLVRGAYDGGFDGLWFDLVEESLPEMLFP